MKIVHIGLPKTATTYLQHKVFPKISEKKNLDFNKAEYLIRDHTNKMKFAPELVDKLDFNDNDFISSEALSGWSPHLWENYANLNLKAFGENSHILITLREPEDYLKSLYLQRNIHQFELKKFTTFIGNHDTEKLFGNFVMKNFYFTHLIDLYKKRFKKVSVIKLSNLEKIDQVFDTNIFSLSQKKSTKVKKSPSLLSYKFIMFFLFLNQKILKYFLRSFIKKNIIKFLKKKITSKNIPHYVKNYYLKKFDLISSEDLGSYLISSLLHKFKFRLLINFFDKISDKKEIKIADLDKDLINKVSSAKKDYLSI